MKKKALVIEDEESIREYMSYILRNNGFQVVEAKNRTEGLQYFSGAHIDLVLTDMVMPDGGGGEIMAAIRGANPAVPVIAVSGAMSYNELVAGAGKGGADATIQKPFTESELMNTIRRCMKKPS
jgi:DNA-binding NtrC family response regulator